MIHRFDTFDHHADLEIRRDLEKASKDCHAGVAWREIAREGPVDLDDIDRHVEQMGQCRKTSPKIIERDKSAVNRSSRMPEATTSSR